MDVLKRSVGKEGMWHLQMLGPNLSMLGKVEYLYFYPFALSIRVLKFLPTYIFFSITVSKLCSCVRNKI